MQQIVLPSIYRDISKGVLWPIGQIILFILATGLGLSLLMLLLATLFRGTPIDQLVTSNNGTSLWTYTLVNLPQVLVDGVTLGFVYAAIALGYTMVYGVLEFINFAHSEIFAIGAFVGVELLIFINNAGLLPAALCSALIAWWSCPSWRHGRFGVGGCHRRTHRLSPLAQCAAARPADFRHRGLLLLARRHALDRKLDHR